MWQVKIKSQTDNSPEIQPKATEVPNLFASDKQIQVRVHATSVNPINWYQASGQQRPILRARFPHFIPGYDVAVVVKSVG